MDQLIAFKSHSLDDVINAMFFRKMPRYIRDVVNPKDYKKLYDLGSGATKYWRTGTDAGLMSGTAVQRFQPPAHSNCRSSSPSWDEWNMRAKSSHC
jgi:hypothetical protein